VDAAKEAKSEARFLGIDSRISDIEASLRPFAGLAPNSARDRSNGANLVTREQMAEALDRTEKRIERTLAQKMEREFGNQAQAIRSLRAMIEDTDTLLERVLSRLESRKADTEPEEEFTLGRRLD
jgi:hypothetical protein